MQKELFTFAHSLRFYRLFRWLAYFTALALILAETIGGFLCTVYYAARQAARAIWINWGVFTAQIQQTEAEYRKLRAEKQATRTK